MKSNIIEWARNSISLPEDNLIHTLIVLLETSRLLSTNGWDGLGSEMIQKSSGLVIQILKYHLNIHIVSLRYSQISMRSSSFISEAERWKVPQAAFLSFLFTPHSLSFPLGEARRAGERGSCVRRGGGNDFFNWLLAVTLIMTMRFSFSFGREMRATDFKWYIMVGLLNNVPQRSPCMQEIREDTDAVSVSIAV